jgi:cell wall assembly regulator SMI1
LPTALHHLCSCPTRDRWLENNYPELFDQPGESRTQNDKNELEHELDCSLPQDVRDSLAIHDEQERGGTPTGVVFGCMLLDCEEIAQEWKNWRKYLNARAKPQPEYPIKSLNNASSSSSSSSSSHQAQNMLWRQELMDRQDSQPPKAIHGKSPRDSPYSSPTASNDERGRSPHHQWSQQAVQPRPRGLGLAWGGLAW